MNHASYTNALDPHRLSEHEELAIYARTSDAADHDAYFSSFAIACHSAQSSVTAAVAWHRRYQPEPILDKALRELDELIAQEPNADHHVVNSKISLAPWYSIALPAAFSLAFVAFIASVIIAFAMAPALIAAGATALTITTISLPGYYLVARRKRRHLRTLLETIQQRTHRYPHRQEVTRDHWTHALLVHIGPSANAPDD